MRLAGMNVLDHVRVLTVPAPVGLAVLGGGMEEELPAYQKREWFTAHALNQSQVP